jgi:hypothetical protein
VALPAPGIAFTSLVAVALRAGPAAGQTGDPLPAPVVTPAAGKRAGENAVRGAGDAFGTVIGREEIGLYGADDIRGFSPVAAGNVRIDGLYFDPVAFPSGRISGATSIRVGPSALGSPFPAPTGIVDIGLRLPDDAAAGSALVSLDSFGGRQAELDVALPLTDRLSLGAGLTKQIAFSREPGDIGDQYNSFLDCEEIDVGQVGNGDVVISRNGKLLRPKRLASNLFQFRAGSGEDRCVLDCINSLQNGADLLWIETEKPHIGQIAGMVNRIRDVIPTAKLVYNNSPSFNWTLNFRQQVYDAMVAAGKDVSAYDRARLMSVDYDATELAQEADERIRTFQRDAAAQAGIFHHLITLPTYHTAALSTDNLAKEYFGDAGMLGYVKNVQRAEIRQGIACVKHQNMSGSDIGDDHKEYFAGEAALKAGGAHNTMNQFAA